MVPRSSNRLRSQSSRDILSLSDETTDSSSSAYKSPDYVNKLEAQGCFMHELSAGPASEDIALCEQLLSQKQPTEPPPLQNTMFEDECIKDFLTALRNRSEARLLVDLHPLLMPCAENQHIKKDCGIDGINNKCLENVIDGYNDLWNQAICGPKPKPDHARGLKESTFSESQLRKLQSWKLPTKSNNTEKSSPYAVRHDMYFPYLTAEIKSTCQHLEYADRANMHSMCCSEGRGLSVPSSPVS